jgi:N utilization substance protein B
MTSHVTSYHAPSIEPKDFLNSSNSEDWFERNSLFPCDDENDDENDELVYLPGRRMSRVIALQVLAEMDVTDHIKDVVLSWLLENNNLDESSGFFASYLVDSVLDKINEIDDSISIYATAWPISQVSIVDRNVLRIAFFEIIFDRDTPYQIVVSEAVEIAKLFGGDSSPKFVNGVLGALIDNEILENSPIF